MDSVDLKGKTVVITGSNTGIGKATAVGVARKGARVLLACRNLERAEEARKEVVEKSGNTNVETRQLDLSSLNSVREFCTRFNAEEPHLDILICNAGLLANKHEVTEDGFESMFQVNHLGHFLLTNLLLDKLKSSAPSRVVVVSSCEHEKNPVNFDDLQSEKGFDILKVYGQSKTCNLLFAVQLAKVLKDTGVTVYAVHPGLVNSEIGRYMFGLSSRFLHTCAMYINGFFTKRTVKSNEEGAQTSLYCSLEPSIAKDSGKYYCDSQEKEAMPHATNEESANKLWAVSENLCGLK